MKLGKSNVADIYFGKTRLAACFINKKLAYSPYSWGLNIQVVTNAGITTAMVTGIGSFNGGNLIIQPKYNGVPVTMISMNAFQNCTSITSVVIPETITALVSETFNGCTNLKEARYMGTIAQCNELPALGTLKSHFNGTQVTKIQCSDGDIVF